MKRIVELKTGLFRDAETVAAAIAASAAAAEVAHLDLTGLASDDRDGWERAAEAILRADLAVTL